MIRRDNQDGMIWLKRKRLGQSGIAYGPHIGIMKPGAFDVVTFYHKDPYVDDKDQDTGKVRYSPEKVSCRVIVVGPRPVEVQHCSASWVVMALSPYRNRYRIDDSGSHLRLEADRCASVCVVFWSCPPSYVA